MALDTRYVSPSGDDSISFKTALGMAADATAGLNSYKLEWTPFANPQVITIDFGDGEGPQDYKRES